MDHPLFRHIDRDDANGLRRSLWWANVMRWLVAPVLMLEDQVLAVMFRAVDKNAPQCLSVLLQARWPFANESLVRACRLGPAYSRLVTELVPYADHKYKIRAIDASASLGNIPALEAFKPHGWSAHMQEVALAHALRAGQEKTVDVLLRDTFWMTKQDILSATVETLRGPRPDFVHRLLQHASLDTMLEALVNAPHDQLVLADALACQVDIPVDWQDRLLAKVSTWELPYLHGLRHCRREAQAIREGVEAVDSPDQPVTRISRPRL